MGIIKKLSGLSKTGALLTSVGLIILIIVADYSNGKEVSFRILYLIPVSIATWNAGLMWGIIISLISAASKIYVDLIQGVAYSRMIFFVWEGIIVFGIFTVYVIILNKLKETLKTLADKNKQLEEANELKDEFLSIASHDLKNPLNNILNFGSIISEEPEMPVSEIEKIGRHIRDISLRMFKIIDNLITSAAIEMGEFNVNYEIVDIVETVKSVIKRNYSNANKKSIEINLVCNSSKIIVNTDGNLIMQVVDNLISNSLKFSPPNKKIMVRIIDSTEETNLITLEIQDEGPGFSEEDKLRLFSRFGKLSARPTGKESSTGLGLYIVKKYIDAMKGKISCISEKGRGTKFVVKIPVSINNIES